MGPTRSNNPQLDKWLLDCFCTVYRGKQDDCSSHLGSFGAKADDLDRMNAIVDNLALAPVNDDELVQIVLNNLGHAFEMTVSATQARDSPITYPTLEALLLTTERRMMDQTASLAETAPVNAFVVSRGCGGGRTCRIRRCASPSNQRGYNHRNNNIQCNQPGNGEKFVSNGERIVCQICGKPGHPALDCYQRMNAAYEGPEDPEDDFPREM